MKKGDTINLSIVPVTEKNRAEAEKLHVAASQKNFIETVPQCMAEADELSDWEPVLIMEGETPVGFSMYGLMRHEENHRLWFDRLLVDEKYQHRGIGRRAVELLLERLRRDFPGRDIYLSAYEDNSTAIALYSSFGFRFNGELDCNGEKIMLLKA